MKCLSLWQPWATLVAIGTKQYETRHWSTNYRGPLLIHAAKTEEEAGICFAPFFRDALKAAGYHRFSELPRGEVVAMVELMDVVRVEKMRDHIGEAEKAFGNYADGRYAWVLGKVSRIENAPVRGAQGLFNAELPVGHVVYAEAYKPEAIYGLHQLRMF